MKNKNYFFVDDRTNNFKQATKRAGLTYFDLARILEVSESLIAKYSTGRLIPARSLQEKISLLLNEPTWILFSRKGR